MRILFACHGFPPLQNAGAERAAERVAAWMAANGHQVQVLTVADLTTEGPLTTVEQSGLLVHRLSYNINSGGQPFQKTYNHPSVLAGLEELFSHNQYDLIHIISGYLLAGPVIRLARERGIPVVITLTEFFFMCPRLNLMHPDMSLCYGPESVEKCARCCTEEKRRYQTLRNISPLLMDMWWSIYQQTPGAHRYHQAVLDRQNELKQLLESVDSVICPSQFIIHKFAEYGFDTSKFVFIQHGLNYPSNTIAVRPDKPGSLKLGFIGQIKAHKGVDLPIEVVLSLLEAGYKPSLQIWGDPNDQPAYSQPLMEKTKDQPAVQWNGAFRGNQVWSILNHMDVLVVPSRWFENCPTVILEAFAMGVPVIAARAGGMAELVSHGKNGLLFSMNDADDLRAQVKCLLDDVDLLRALRSEARLLRSGNKEAEEIFALYQHVVTDYQQTANKNGQ